MPRLGLILALRYHGRCKRFGMNMSAIRPTKPLNWHVSSILVLLAAIISAVLAVLTFPKKVEEARHVAAQTLAHRAIEAAAQEVHEVNGFHLGPS